MYKYINNTKSMKKKICFWAFTIIFGTMLLGCSSESKTSKDGQGIGSEIKVMTFNILYGSADDGENSWDKRKNMLYEVIRESYPDLIGFQEALKFQIDNLLEALPQYSYIGVGRDDGKTSGEYSCIFYSKDRFIVDTTETFWFSETPKVPGSKSWGNDLTRICTWGLLFDKFEKKDIYMYNMHLDYMSQNSRVKSTESLVKKIAENGMKHPIIVTGDFNSGENNQAVKNLIDFGLVDTYRTLYKKAPNEGTFNRFKGDDTSDKIDFIFVSKELKALKSKIIKTNWNGRYPSDHFPVAATISY